MHKFFKGYHLDLRSLALMRILLGAFLIVELSYYFLYQDVFLGDLGFLPRKDYLGHYAMNWSWSVFYMTGEPIVTNILLAIGIISSFMVMVGNRTRFFSLVCWFFIVSLHNRNWFLINAGDDLLRVMFFMGVFLPWGHYYSVDHALAKNKNDIKTTIYHPTSYWLIVQIACVYFFSYFYKTNSIWRSEFTAIFYTLQLDVFTTFIGKAISEFRSFLKAATAFVIYLELLGPILLLFHGLLFGYKNYLRTFIIFCFVLFHLGLILTMTIGQFPYICIAVWLGLLPSSFWNRLFAQKGINNSIIYYDGQCGFCYKGVLLLKEFFKINSKLYPAQVNIKVQKLMNEYNSWVVFDEKSHQYYFRYEAFLILIQDRWFRILFNNPLMRNIGNIVYLLISKNRGFFSSITAIFKLRTINLKKSYLIVLVTASMILGTLVWNINVLGKYQIPLTHQMTIFRYLHLYQHWDMFSPNPKLDDTWFVFEGVFNDKKREYLLFPQEKSKDAKAIYVKNVTTKHWRKMFANLMNNNELKKYFIEYLCRYYNIINYSKKRAKLLEVTVREYSQMNTLYNKNTEKIELPSVTHSCF